MAPVSVYQDSVQHLSGLMNTLSRMMSSSCCEDYRHNTALPILPSRTVTVCPALDPVLCTARYPWFLQDATIVRNRSGLPAAMPTAEDTKAFYSRAEVPSAAAVTTSSSVPWVTLLTMNKSLRTQPQDAVLSSTYKQWLSLSM
jgi:hypothetical protein